MTKPNHINHNLWIVHDTMRETVTSVTQSTFNIATSYIFWLCFISSLRKKKGGKTTRRKENELVPHDSTEWDTWMKILFRFSGRRVKDGQDNIIQKKSNYWLKFNFAFKNFPGYYDSELISTFHIHFKRKTFSNWELFHTLLNWYSNFRSRILFKISHLFL
jgi:hypothetical protein